MKFKVGDFVYNPNRHIHTVGWVIETINTSNLAIDQYYRIYHLYNKEICSVQWYEYECIDVPKQYIHLISLLRTTLILENLYKNHNSCICSTRDLVIKGCQCGQFLREIYHEA